jgi:hypothetical protein
MKELIPENNYRLNQESKKALVALKLQPDGTALHCLQLAQWAVKRWDDEDGRLKEMIWDWMPGWKPKKVMRFLTTNLDNGEECEPVPWEKVKDNPEELADQIVVAISDQLVNYLEAYPRHMQPKI